MFPLNFWSNLVGLVTLARVPGLIALHALELDFLLEISICVEVKIFLVKISIFI